MPRVSASGRAPGQTSVLGSSCGGGIRVQYTYVCFVLDSATFRALSFFYRMSSPLSSREADIRRAARWRRQGRQRHAGVAGQEVEESGEFAYFCYDFFLQPVERRLCDASKQPSSSSSIYIYTPSSRGCHGVLLTVERRGIR